MDGRFKVSHPYFLSWIRAEHLCNNNCYNNLKKKQTTSSPLFTLFKTLFSRVGMIVQKCCCRKNFLAQFSHSSACPLIYCHFLSVKLLIFLQILQILQISSVTFGWIFHFYQRAWSVISSMETLCGLRLIVTVWPAVTLVAFFSSPVWKNLALFFILFLFFIDESLTYCP